MAVITPDPGRAGTIGRRGVFFTLMAILAVTVLLIVQQQGVRQNAVLATESSSSSQRVSVMDQYVNTFEQHAANSLRTAGYFALQNMSARVGTSGYFTDMNASITDCLNNKTTPYKCLNKTTSINDSLARIVAVAKSNLSINTSYNIESVWVSESQPFSVDFWMNISYNVSDPVARWEVHRTVRTAVDINGIQDPAYANEVRLGTLSRSRNFSKTDIKYFEFYNTTFYRYYRSKSYSYSPNGSSALMRFRGQFGAGSTCCGVESVIHSDELSAPTKSDSRLVNWSFVDYQFITRNTLYSGFDCNSREIGPLRGDYFPDKWVRLDQEHIENSPFNVSAAADYFNCTLPT